MSVGSSPPDTAVIVVEPGADQVVSCSGRAFPLGALENLTPLQDLPEVEAAIDEFLSSGEGDFWPQDGWHVVDVSETALLAIILQSEAQVRQDAEERGVGATFDDGFGDGIDDTISLSLQSVDFVEGSWRWSGSSSGEDCVLETLLPEGFGRVEWELESEAPAPNAASTTLNLSATEQDCVSGQAMGERLQPAWVTETETTVFITLAAIPPEGDAFDCPGNPSQSVTVELASPLGDREVVDGQQTAGRLSDYVGETFGLGP